ncbi:DedA family protein [Candidatus Ferrigenium straubiae]|jgi:membrane protein DedA with SNARE-associated domain|uniref:DedA family protein n=1 Tax=Candidatus Ferrigenium straubiae TaxID=2919506 RepID=UPI003F4AE978
MTLTALIASYGYYALFAGTFLEGETVLIAAGFAAHRGMLDLSWVIAIAFVASTLGDQSAFLLGRWQGERLLQRFPALRRKAPVVQSLLDRYHVPLILGVRFFYGLRIAGPFVIGMSSIPFLVFALLNMAGALVWAVAVASAGYYFGVALESWIGNLKQFEETVLVIILAAGAGIWLWRRRKS